MNLFIATGSMASLSIGLDAVAHDYGAIDRTTGHPPSRVARCMGAISRLGPAGWRCRPHWTAHLFQSGYGIRTIQELLGHRDVSTTMIYTHVLNAGGRGVLSPLDDLP